MRDLNECQAEVFRRSEKRIKARRQRRKHILLACIPLALCVTLFSAFILPAMMPAGSEAPEANGALTGGMTAGGAEGFVSPVAKIEVSGPNVSFSYTEASDILLISSHLNACTVMEQEISGSQTEETRDESIKENAAAGDDRDGGALYSTSTGFAITLLMHDGSKTEYYLAGNMLTNRTANQTCTLSQKQVNELKDLLGIPHDHIAALRPQTIAEPITGCCRNT